MQAESRKNSGTPDLSTRPFPGWLRFNRSGTVAVSLLFLVGLFACIARLQVQYQEPSSVFDAGHTGYCDFHNGVYFPSRAFAKRTSPYGESYAQQYPTPRPIPCFSPSTLILHLPFALLPMKVAEVAFFAWLIFLLLLLSWLTVRFSGIRPAWQHVLLVASFVLFSRAGHGTMFTGYFTFELVIGTIVALQYAHSRPFVSACGLLLASGKPTYVIPLGLLMLARGNWRAVLYGGILSALVAAVGFGWLVSNSDVASLVEGVKQGQMEHLDDPVEFPVNTWLRVDAPAIISKWLEQNPGELVQLGMMCALIAPICYVIWKNHQRLQDNEGASSIVGAVCCLSVVFTFYHHSYDLLVLAAPCFAIAAGRLNWRGVSPAWRYALLICLLLPLFNYSTAGSLLERYTERGDLIHKVVTSVNSLLLLIATIISCILASREIKPE